MDMNKLTTIFAMIRERADVNTNAFVCDLAQMVFAHMNDRINECMCVCVSVCHLYVCMHECSNRVSTYFHIHMYIYTCLYRMVCMYYCIYLCICICKHPSLPWDVSIEQVSIAETVLQTGHKLHRKLVLSSTPPSTTCMTNSATSSSSTCTVRLASITVPTPQK